MMVKLKRAIIFLYFGWAFLQILNFSASISYWLEYKNHPRYGLNANRVKSEQLADFVRVEDAFFAFQNEYYFQSYDITEFLVYTIAPILAFFGVRYFRFGKFW